MGNPSNATSMNITIPARRTDFSLPLDSRTVSLLVEIFPLTNGGFIFLGEKYRKTFEELPEPNESVMQ